MAVATEYRVSERANGRTPRPVSALHTGHTPDVYVTAPSASVCYAPVVDTRSGTVYGVEAVLGSAGAPQPLTDLAVVAALEDLASYSLAGGHALRLGLEVPALLLSDRSFHRRLADMLAMLALDPSMITLGVRRNSLPQHATRAAQICAELRQTGCRLALRRDGVDWDSAAQLAQFPIDLVWLDPHVVSNIDCDPILLRAMQRMLRFAGGIGLAVVAGGVERMTQYEQLRALGCRYVKGPLLGFAAPLQSAAANLPV